MHRPVAHTHAGEPTIMEQILHGHFTGCLLYTSLGRPKDFVVTVRQIEIASGAGFIIPITGSIMRMPGLPDIPAAEKIDIDNNGKITGLF